MKNALVIRHVAFEDLGLFEKVLENTGYSVRYLEAGMDELSSIEPLSPDLLIVLGGPISANDGDQYPFINDELNILKTRLNEDAPTLGICLGAQLMIKSLGEKVYPATEKELGWDRLLLTEEGRSSPLKHISAENTPVLHWHGETFDLPEGATLLASTSKVKHQAFSWKQKCLGLQFHPEVTLQGMERWFIGHTLEIEQTPDVSVEGLLKDTQKYANAMEAHGRAFFEEWLLSII